MPAAAWFGILVHPRRAHECAAYRRSAIVEPRQFAGAAYQRHLTIADAVLSGLVSRVEHDQGSASARLVMHDFLVHEARRSDRLHGIFIYAADGSWVSSSLNSTPRKHNNADRAYFKYHRDHRDALSLVGPPVQSRSDGSWVLTLSRRLNTPAANLPALSWSRCN